MDVEAWKARADREAAAIIAEIDYSGAPNVRVLQSVAALAWLEGFKAAEVERLAALDAKIEAARR